MKQLRIDSEVKKPSHGECMDYQSYYFSLSNGKNVGVFVDSGYMVMAAIKVGWIEDFDVRAADPSEVVTLSKQILDVLNKVLTFDPKN